MDKQEVIYQRCMSVKIGDCREGVDFFLEKEILAGSEAITGSEDSHIVNYTEAFDLSLGLLINFGARSLEIGRLTAKSVKKLP